MYIKLQRKNLPQFYLCVKIKFRTSILEDFTFLTSARTSTFVATPKICIELLDCRPDLDPLAAGEGSGLLETSSEEGVLVSRGGTESCVAA